MTFPDPVPWLSISETFSLFSKEIKLKVTCLFKLFSGVCTLPIYCSVARKLSSATACVASTEPKALITESVDASKCQQASLCPRSCKCCSLSVFASNIALKRELCGNSCICRAYSNAWSPFCPSRYFPDELLVIGRTARYNSGAKWRFSFNSSSQ